MEQELDLKWHHDARRRLAIAMAAGVVASIPIGLYWHPQYVPLLGWVVTALVYSALTWFGIWWMNPQQTAAHATAEIPGGTTVHILLLLAALASLGGIALIVFQHPTSRLTAFVVAIITVTASWLVVQTIYALRYARRYYREVQGVDFHGGDQPQYSDFAYLATTIGMSYTVADSGLGSKQFRKMILGHALLAFVFVTVFVSALVNIFAGLATSMP